jgi:hypothetical protein
MRPDHPKGKDFYSVDANKIAQARVEGYTIASDIARSEAIWLHIVR